RRDSPEGRRRDGQHHAAVARRARALRAGAQAAARAGQAAVALRDGRRRLLDGRDRAPRSPASVVCDLERALAALVDKLKTTINAEPQSSQTILGKISANSAALRCTS